MIGDWKTNREKYKIKIKISKGTRAYGWDHSSYSHCKPEDLQGEKSNINKIK